MSPKSEDQRRFTKEGELLSDFLDTMQYDVHQSIKVIETKIQCSLKTLQPSYLLASS